MIVHVNHSIRFMLLCFRILRIMIFFFNFFLTVTNSLMWISNWIVASGDDIVNIEVKKRSWCYRLGVKWFEISFFHLKQAIQMIFNLRFRCSVHEKFRLIFKHRNSLFDNSHLGLALICNFFNNVKVVKSLINDISLFL